MKQRGGSLPGAAILLLIAFVSLEVFLRYGVEYDLVRGHVPLGSYDGAPVYAFFGVIILVAAIVGGIALLVALYMLARSRASVARMALTLIPALLLLGAQYLLAAVDENKAPARMTARQAAALNEAAAKEMAGLQLENAGAAWAARTHLLRASGCKELGQSTRFVDGCERFVSRQVGSDPYTLGQAGAAWAVVHHITDENDCRSSKLPDFEEDLYFIASCKRQVWDQDRHRGESWARSHNLRNFEECEPRAGEPVPHPEFLTGCRAGITAMRVESAATVK